MAVPPHPVELRAHEERLAVVFSGGRCVLAVGFDTRKSLPEVLSAAESDVVLGLLTGQSTRAIAAARQTSERTVANQISSILQKIGAGSRFELANRVLSGCRTCTQRTECMTCWWQSSDLGAEDVVNRRKDQRSDLELVFGTLEPTRWIGRCGRAVAARLPDETPWVAMRFTKNGKTPVFSSRVATASHNVQSLVKAAQVAVRSFSRVSESPQSPGRPAGWVLVSTHFTHVLAFDPVHQVGIVVTSRLGASAGDTEQKRDALKLAAEYMAMGLRVQCLLSAASRGPYSEGLREAIDSAPSLAIYPDLKRAFWRSIAAGVLAVGDLFVHQSVVYVPGFASDASDQQGRAGLSDRELFSVELAARGCSNKAIAAHLGVSVSAAAAYLRRATRKLALDSRMNLVTMVSLLSETPVASAIRAPASEAFLSHAMAPSTSASVGESRPAANTGEGDFARPPVMARSERATEVGGSQAALAAGAARTEVRLRDAAAGDRLELSFIDRSSGEEVGHALVTFDFGAGEQAIRMEQDGKVVFERQSAANLERDEIEEKVLALYVRHRSLGNL